MSSRLGIAVLLVAASGLPAATLVQKGSLDPAFARVPFDEWMEGAGQAQIRWSAKAAPVTLSNHQRWLARVDVTLDGAEVARRRGKGEFVVFFQLTDGEGHKFQDHGTIDLAKMEAGIKASDIVYSEMAFVLPGDYGVALAILSTATGEHCVKREKLHVAPLKGDPLPHAWEGLPSVEFRPNQEMPDLWFQPSITSRLNLEMETRLPTQVDLLLNLTPAERSTGSQRVQDLGLALMLPAMKVLTNIEWRNASLQVTLMDLLRQKIPFEQKEVKRLDWERMRGSLAGAEPGKIDVKSLGERQHQASFFVTEVGKRLAPGRVVIVFSSVVAFEAGEDLSPIGVPVPAGCSVYYFRFHQPVTRTIVATRAPPLGRRPAMGYPTGRMNPIPIDQLAATLKPLNPRIFDIESPEQFRSALAATLSELYRQ